ncbi:hypothetical protein ACFX13_012828 [Malus domestica]
MQTYALAWVDSAHKIHYRVEKVGGENPTWNDRFLFKVPSRFLPSKTSKVPSFTDIQIRRPFGRFQDVLKVAAMVIDGSYLASAVIELSAVGYRDLMGKMIELLTLATRQHDERIEGLLRRFEGELLH